MALRQTSLILAAALWFTAWGSNNKIWYAQPAEKWMEAIPIGNGRLSGMVYGGLDIERVALNEISLWSGQHDPTSNDLCGKEQLAEMREAFFNNDPEKGNELGNTYLNGRMTSFGSHVPMGDLKLLIKHASNFVTDYRRELDLNNAIATVSYKVDDTTYTRQYIADYPDQIMAIRITADKPDAVTLTASLDLLRQAEVVAKDSMLSYGGKVDFPMHGPGGVNFCGAIKLVPEGGKVSYGVNSVSVDGADALTILVDIRTDYADGAYKESCRQNVVKGQAKGWNAMLADHLKDYRKLFGRVDIQLGEYENDNLPTDVRLRRVGQGVVDADFDALFFQYGRYMLISSSRPNGTALCANLQGVWNDNGACNMPWTCDYHMDINTAQNYWSANRANLAECNEPLFNYIGFLAQHGKETAEKMYGCRGWVAHTVCNAWGYTAPGWGVSWGMNVTGGAWLATHLWSHYLYTQDKEWLANVGYPLIKETAIFFKDYMVKDPRTGYLVTGPSISPENGYVSEKGNHLSLDMMPTIDRAIVYDIYDACIRSASILGKDKKFAAQLQKDIRKLPPIVNGRDGQVQEWLGDLRRSDPSHRHSSHLLSLFPLNQVTIRKTPELIEGAKKGLALQTASEGWEDTEWSTANMLCFQARIHDAEKAHGWLQNLFKTFTRDNLMTVSPAGVAMAEWDIFSFDATEASVAGMCEMLVQSHDGCVDLLPALPKAWKTGSVKGLCTEGNLTADLDWKNMKMSNALFTAGSDVDLKLAVPEGTFPRFEVNGQTLDAKIANGIASIKLNKNDKLNIRFQNI